jgi:Protein of unknown function (DUF2628)
MARFVIFEPAEAIGDDAVSKARFIRDGFSFFGFLIPPLWLLWHRLFIEAALVFAALFATGALGEMMQGMGLAAPLLSLLLSFYIGLEGAGLRIAALRRRGWLEWGTVDADTLADAEIRYATAVSEGYAPEVSPPPRPPMPTAAVRPDTGPALGLLAYPGGA